ncbi:GNAT family N-acetyltransferase [Nocardioides sp. TF02-7]|uniref:GNAT family N-acetyltransferase n=1 Tax=Nocardioides sp. TF02-7 TaxID=2917724 RepID=UPI001F058B8A|nr:GNAT family N-acetyltransferase [Nocardioides sp. TF02-7]UMG94840.1 N-acetyltransferase [Nocardioides sp. TF02-7]
MDLSHDPAARRYVARVGGAPAGYAEYVLTDELVVFTHTEVDPAFEGQGVGSALARFALDDVRAAGGRKVLPVCPFIKAWMRRHEDYYPLLHNVPESTARD